MSENNKKKYKNIAARISCPLGGRASTYITFFFLKEVVSGRKEVRERDVKNERKTKKIA